MRHSPSLLAQARIVALPKHVLRLSPGTAVAGVALPVPREHREERFFVFGKLVEPIIKT